MCGQPQIRKTTFQSHPPLIAFQWRGEPPLLNTRLQINHNDIAKEYLLTGVIYYTNQHFTGHFLKSAGCSWHHDGMARSRALILQRPSQGQLATAIVAVYTMLGRVASQNLGFPCKVLAHVLTGRGQ
ncbi:hypothetical protein L208DRAFT_1290976 [Tricholoma matsutake]|nr:hypothetical protein L208DRAFT_1290976 [Tricholoma matsutake 945]